MTAVLVYDIDANRLEKIAERRDTTVAELIEEMLDVCEESEE